MIRKIVYHVKAGTKTYLADFNILADAFVTKYLSHDMMGFSARVVLLTGVVGVAGYGGFTGFCLLQGRKPIAKRWAPRTERITLIEKVPMEPGSDVWIYRFALPNTYDYAGYEPVSSVTLQSTEEFWWQRKKRWFTPISHPEQRGIIEFAIKLKDPGVMSSFLRHMRSGQTLTMGRWIKEYKYKKNQHPEIDMLL